MSIESYVEHMQNIQRSILTYLDGDDENPERNLKNIQDIIENLNSQENKHKLELLIHMISKIANNHYRATNFFDKIKQILILIKNLIKENFSNEEIFKIFKGNKLGSEKLSFSENIIQILS